MHVAVDGRELLGHRTGVGRYLAELVARWTRHRGLADHRLTLVVPADDEADAAEGLTGREGVVTDWLRVGAGRGTRWEQVTLAGAINRLRPDVLFAPAYSAPLFVRVPVVVSIHDVSFAAHPEWFHRREGARRRWLARLGARRARLVLTLSQFSRDEIVRHLGAPADRIRVIPAAADRHPALTDRDAATPSREPTTREPLILFVGTIFNRRHLPDLIAAFGRLARARPDVHLVIVGENRTCPHQDLAEAAVASGATGRIGFARYVSEAALEDLYARARAFAFLSAYEGFGLPPLEALSRGVPVVALDTPVAREVLGDGAILVAAGDPDALTSALASAIDEGPVRDRLLAAAPAVVARYSWDRTATETFSALRDAARGSSRGRPRPAPSS